jgi:topoisomerase-4 subunit A
MEIAKERAKLARECEELAKLVESPARQRTRLKKDLAEVKAKYGDARRTRIEEVAATREIDWSAMIEKEPITVILSQRGWIRAMKGHVAAEEIDAIKYREGDGLGFLVRASTTDRLVLIGDNGRAYTLAGDKLPGGRGFGEPVRLLIDLDGEVGIAALMVVRPAGKYLVVASDGRGFVTSGEATLAETRKGKQLVNLRPGARVAVFRAIVEGADAVAVIGENRKLLVFPLGELPELGRGQGVQLQRYRDGGLADAVAFRLTEGLSWSMGGESGRTRTESDLGLWRAARGAAGRMPPLGFPRSNRFNTTDVKKSVATEN